MPGHRRSPRARGFRRPRTLCRRPWAIVLAVLALCPTGQARAAAEGDGYQQAVAQLNQVHAGGSAQQRRQQADAAVEALQTFLATQPPAPRAAAAEILRAEALIQRSRAETELAAALEEDALDKKRLLQHARAGLQEAIRGLADLEKRFDQSAAKFPKSIGPRRAVSAEEQAQRRQVLEIRLLSALARAAFAETVPAGSEPYRRVWAGATSSFRGLARAYPNYLVGMTARLEAARCQQQLGERGKARESLAELLALPADAAAYRPLRDAAYAVLLELDLHTVPLDLADAIAQAQAWAPDIAPQGPVSEDGRRVQLLAGTAWLEQARGLAAEDPQRAAALQQARRLLTLVAQSPGSQQATAQRRLTDRMLADPQTARREPTTFAEAFARAQDSLERLETLHATRHMAPAPSDQRAADPRAFAAAREETVAALQAALKWTARDSAAGRTPAEVADERHRVLGALAFVHWLSGNWAEAAAQGEALASEDPHSERARQAARIALAAWVELEQRNGETPATPLPLAEVPATETGTPPRNPPATQRIADLAATIDRRWPAQPEADDAHRLLLHLAVREGNPLKIVEMLQLFPEDAPQRAGLELQTGQAIAETLRPAGHAPGAQAWKPEQIERLRLQARDLLQSGLARDADKSGVASDARAAAALTLADVSLALDDPPTALRLLRDPAYGPWITAGSAASAGPSAAERLQAQRTAIRALLASRQAEPARQVLRQANAVLQQVAPAERGRAAEQFCGHLADDLGEDLRQQQVREPAQANAPIVNACRELLAAPLGGQAERTYIEERVAAALWDGLAAAAEEHHDQAREVEADRRQAVVAYARLVERLGREPGFAPGADTPARVALPHSAALRRMGRFPEALAALAEALQAPPVLLEAQFAAAETYQAWGGQDPQYYFWAVCGSPAGAVSDPNVPVAAAPRVWGWGRLVKILARRQNREEMFRQARYNQQECLKLCARGGRELGVRGEWLEQAPPSLPSDRRSP